jgi:hypothetical protein
LPSTGNKSKKKVASVVHALIYRPSSLYYYTILLFPLSQIPFDQIMSHGGDGKKVAHQGTHHLPWYKHVAAGGMAGLNNFR